MLQSSKQRRERTDPLECWPIARNAISWETSYQSSHSRLSNDHRYPFLPQWSDPHNCLGCIWSISKNLKIFELSCQSRSLNWRSVWRMQRWHMWLLHIWLACKTKNCKRWSAKITTGSQHIRKIIPFLFRFLSQWISLIGI